MDTLDRTHNWAGEYAVTFAITGKQSKATQLRINDEQGIIWGVRKEKRKTLEFAWTFAPAARTAQETALTVEEPQLMVPHVQNHDTAVGQPHNIALDLDELVRTPAVNTPDLEIRLVAYPPSERSPCRRSRGLNDQDPGAVALHHATDIWLVLPCLAATCGYETKQKTEFCSAKD